MLSPNEQPYEHGYTIDKLRGYGEGAPFTIPLNKGPKLGPEYNPWYFFPNRVIYSKLPDESFRRKLHEIDPDLEASWNPIKHRWAVWMRDVKMNHPACQGWKLLFWNETDTKEYLPLDERTLAKIYDRSARKWDNAKRYFDRIESEMERDRNKAQADTDAYWREAAGDYWNHTQIQVSMRGESKGSKFSEFHSE